MSWGYAVLKAIAVAIGPFGAPIEAVLNYKNDEQMDRVERGVREASALQERQMTTINQTLQQVFAAQFEKISGLHEALDLASPLILAWRHSPDTQALFAFPNFPIDVKVLPLAVPQTHKEIGRIMREGLRQVQYRNMRELWADLIDTGFDANDFPHDTPNMREGIVEYERVFWRQPVVVQSEVLRTLASRHETIPTLQCALVGHAMLTSQRVFAE